MDTLLLGLVVKLESIRWSVYCTSSKGRSIREFISGVLLVPAIVSFVWFSVFGVLGIETGKKHKEIFDMTPETQLFGVFNHVPFGIVLSLIELSLFIVSLHLLTQQHLY